MTALRRRIALPLRAKLILLTATALTGVLALAGVILYVNIAHILIDTTARGLRLSASAAITDKLNGPDPKPRPAKDGAPLPVPPTSALTPTLTDPKPVADLARFLTTRDTAARTTDTTGNTLGDGPALAEIATVHAPLLDAARYRAVATTNREQHFTFIAPDGPVLIELIPLARAASTQTVGVLQLSTSLGGVDDLLRTLRILLVTGALLALVVTVALTVVIVRGALRPLRRMAITSRAIAAGDLSYRVAVPPGGDELTDLAYAFNEMVSRLDTAFTTQHRFLADASHELRSPLTAPGGGVEMLLIGADAADPAARNRLLRLMGGEIARMGRLVTDLLTLTRFDADPAHALNLVPVDLTALTHEIVDEVRLLAPAHIVMYEVIGAPLTVQGDADQLRQALLNLCANARAHTTPGGTIAIHVTYAAGNALVSVRDTGEGIASDDLPHVWDRFFRADPARTRRAGQGGLGLGLALVRSIIEAHGGTAAITSAPDHGTTVTLTIPGAVVMPTTTREPTRLTA